MESLPPVRRAAIACGGTGGHLFPGLAVAESLASQGCRVQLLVSPKDVDQQALKSVRGMDVVTLPAIGFSRGRWLTFALAFWKSWRLASALFSRERPGAVLGMGGFTSGPPLLAARQTGSATFLHESNAVPGKANRMLVRRVDRVFVAFDEAAHRMRSANVSVTGTPVRARLRGLDPGACRLSLGLQPDKPVLLIMGGSQGARAINRLAMQSLRMLASRFPEMQYIHLTGSRDCDEVRSAYGTLPLKAVVRPFLGEMEWALGAATAAVSRAGGSSLAELAAVRLPAILIPLPSAADHHQDLNARELAGSGAARLLGQPQANPVLLTSLLEDLLTQPELRKSIQTRLARWDFPDAAKDIATRLLAAMQQRESGPARPANSNNETLLNPEAGPPDLQRLNAA